MIPVTREWWRSLLRLAGIACSVLWFFDECVLATTVSGRDTNVLVCLDVARGSVKWEREVPYQVISDITLCDKGLRVFEGVGLSRGVPLWCNPETGSNAHVEDVDGGCAAGRGRRLYWTNFYLNSYGRAERELIPQVGGGGLQGLSVTIYSAPWLEEKAGECAALIGYRKGEPAPIWTARMNQLNLPGHREYRRLDSALRGQYIFCYSDGMLFKIDGKTGTMVASLDALKAGLASSYQPYRNFAAGSIIFPAGESVVVMTSRSVFCFDLDLALLKWSYPMHLEDEWLSTPLLFDNKLFYLRGIDLEAKPAKTGN